MVRHFLASVAGLIIGFLMIGGAVWQWDSIARKKSWPQVEATIINSELVGIETGDDGPSIALRVRYLVTGKEIQATVYTDHFDSGEGRFVRELITDRVPERYSAGNTVSVHYDPNEPTVAQTEFDDSHFSHALRVVVLLIGLVLVIVSSILELTFLFVKFQQWKMHYQLKKARRLISEANDSFDEDDGKLSDRCAQETRATINAQLEETEGLAHEVDAEVAILESVFRDELDDPGEKPGVTERIGSPSRPADQNVIGTNRLREIIICILIALSLGTLSSWFAPYHVISLRSAEDQRVDCHIQRMLFGILPIDKPQAVTNLREVGRKVEQQSRTASHFLVLTGTEAITIPAGHALFTEKRINEYLSAPSGRLLLSDGRLVFGLYVPWIILLWTMLICVVLWFDRERRPNRSTHHASASRIGLLHMSAATRFSFGGVLTWSVVWGVVLMAQDIYRTSVGQWLLLLGISIAGGIVCLSWTARQRSKLPAQK